jgi:hypothetical protein
VCVGGAAGISAPDLDRLAELFRLQLVPLIEEQATTVVDSGTDAGIMRLMGQAREAIGGSFQLIDVAAEGTDIPQTQPNRAPRTKQRSSRITARRGPIIVGGLTRLLSGARVISARQRWLCGAI